MASNRTNVVTESWPAAASSGILAYLACVFDTSTHGNVKLPAGTPELTFAGVATENIDYANNVELQVGGIAICLNDGAAAMNPGDDVILSSAHAGYVKSKALTDGTTGFEVIGKVAGDAAVAGTLGLYVSVRLAPYKVFSA